MSANFTTYYKFWIPTYLQNPYPLFIIFHVRIPWVPHSPTWWYDKWLQVNEGSLQPPAGCIFIHSDSMFTFILDWSLYKLQNYSNFFIALEKWNNAAQRMFVKRFFAQILPFLNVLQWDQGDEAYFYGTLVKEKGIFISLFIPLNETVRKKINLDLFLLCNIPPWIVKT